MDAYESPASPARWISVVFFQGEDADETIAMINRDGEPAAIEFLRQWDFGDETTDAALVNGYVYDEIPAGWSDRTVETGDGYVMTYSELYGYVSLVRRYDAAPDPALVTAHGVSHEASVPFEPAHATWQPPPPDLSAHRTRHSVAL